MKHKFKAWLSSVKASSRYRPKKRWSEKLNANRPSAPEASLARQFGQYLSSRELTEYDHIHFVRLTETLLHTSELYRSGLNLIEMGGLSRLAQFLGSEFGLKVQEYTADLRQPLKLPSSAYDIVFMLEVLEHLNDRHSSESSIEEIAMFTGSGAIACMNELFRILKPGGFCVLTTPNAISVDCLGRLLLKKHPFQYQPHVREYAPQDVEKLACSLGFLIEKSTTFNAWNPLPGYDRNQLTKAIQDLGFDPSDRGDDLLFILKKPETPQS